MPIACHPSLPALVFQSGAGREHRSTISAHPSALLCAQASPRVQNFSSVPQIAYRSQSPYFEISPRLAGHGALILSRDCLVRP